MDGFSEKTVGRSDVPPELACATGCWPARLFVVGAGIAAGSDKGVEASGASTFGRSANMEVLPKGFGCALGGPIHRCEAGGDDGLPLLVRWFFSSSSETMTMDDSPGAGRTEGLGRAAGEDVS
jgi:hypothetical protein